MCDFAFIILFVAHSYHGAGKGDPPSQSASAKDAQREKELDLMLKDPPRLPAYLSQHNRRASRVDVEVVSISEFS